MKRARISDDKKTKKSIRKTAKEGKKAQKKFPVWS